MEEFFPIFLMIGTNLRRSILETFKEKLGNENGVNLPKMLTSIGRRNGNVIPHLELWDP